MKLGGKLGESEQLTFSYSLLEFLELLLRAWCLADLEYIEADSLG